jgi:hypothetical protein
MEKRRKLLFLAGLVLLGVVIAYISVSVAGSINVIDKHKNAATNAINNTECLSCHDNILVQTSPANSTTDPQLSGHKRHFMTVFLNFANNVATGLGGGTNDRGCVKCHPKTDINDSGGYSEVFSRKQVDPQLCLKCHGKFKATTNHQASFHKVNDAANVVASANATDEATAITLANEAKTDFNAHRSSATYHNNVDTGVGGVAVELPNATDLASLVALVNEIKGDYTTHRTQSSADVHKNEDRVNVVASPSAIDLASAVALINEIKADFNTHRTGYTTVDIIDARGCASTNACHYDSLTGKTAAVAHAGKDWINAAYANSTTYCLKCHGGEGTVWYLPEETN